MPKKASALWGHVKDVDVNIQDQTTEIIDLHLTQFLDDIVILAPIAVDGNSINVETTGTVPAIGNLLCLQEGTHFMQSGILTVTPIAGNQYTLTVDSPFDYPFTIEGGCALSNRNLALNGSGTPILTGISPRNLDDSVEWDIVRMIIHIEGSSAMDDGLFGDIAALTKGIVFRVKDGTIKNIFNAKSNGDLAHRAYDIRYGSKAPAGTTSVTIRRTFGGQSKNGVVIRLAALTNDSFQCIIQDNLTGLANFHVIIQGHVVEN